jgi:hypothetical protein
VASLPAPVLRLLILFAGPIAAFRSALEVLSWKPERRVESFMLVGAWWAACLGGEYAFMWLLPPLVFAPLFPLNLMKLGSRSRPPVQPTPSKPATTETLLLTLGDLNKIYALLPPSPLTPVSTAYARFKQLGPLRIVRGLVVLWVSWIVLGRMLGLRILLALIGSGLLLLPSPPLAHVVNLMRKSLFMRRLAALQFVIVFGYPDDRDYALGSPLGWIRSKWAWSRRPAQDLAFEKALKAPEEEHAPADKAGNPIYFRFEVFENQRWWMGLDWTSALLPQERPSWCDVHSLPVSPPMAFTLPASSSIDVPAPTDAEPRAHVRRTATWRWLDDDWNVFKNTGDEKTSTTTSRPQAFKDEDAVSINSTSGSIKQQRRTSGLLGTSPDSADTHARAPSMAEAAFAKGLVRLKSVAPNLSSTPSVTSPVKPSPPQRNRTSSEASNDTAAPVAVEDILAGAAPGPQGQAADRSEPTDNDGWVYGDNKWENMGNKGGLGKVSSKTTFPELVLVLLLTRSLRAGDAGSAAQSAPRQCTG